MRVVLVAAAAAGRAHRPAAADAVQRVLPLLAAHIDLLRGAAAAQSALSRRLRACRGSRYFGDPQ